MSTSHSGVVTLLLLAGLGMVLVIFGLFSYGSRHLRLVAEAEQYLADQNPAVASEVANPSETTIATTSPEVQTDSTQ